MAEGLDDRFRQRAEDFLKAVVRLEEVYQQPYSAFMRDSAIQRFEMVWELAWKVLRLRLQHEGIEALTPRQVFQEAFAAGLIHDGPGWSALQRWRNETSHTYDEALAEEVYAKVRDHGLPLFLTLADDVRTWLQGP